MRKPLVIVLLLLPSLADAGVLYTNAGPITANETGVGSNLAGMSLSRTTTATDTLYFKFTVNPTSNFDAGTYYAGFQFYSGLVGKFGVGNEWAAWAYSSFNYATGPVNLNTATPEVGPPYPGPYQLVRSTDITTIVLKVDFVSGGDDNITVWLNPNLGLSELAQSASLTTGYTADATFDGIHLLEGGAGDGWIFSDIAIAEDSTDTGFFAVPEPSAALLGALGMLGLLRRRRP